jgi:hypothetical protein
LWSLVRSKDRVALAISETGMLPPFKDRWVQYDRALPDVRMDNLL